MTWQHFAYIFQTPRLNIFNVLLKNRSQNTYCVTEGQLVRREFVERVEQLKNMCCNWKSHVNFPNRYASPTAAQFLCLPALTEGGWQELLNSHNKMPWQEIGPAVSPSQPPQDWSALLYIPRDARVTPWCYPASEVCRKMTDTVPDIVSKDFKTVDISLSQTTSCLMFALFLFLFSFPFHPHVVHGESLINMSLSYLCFFFRHLIAIIVCVYFLLFMSRHVKEGWLSAKWLTCLIITLLCVFSKGFAMCLIVSSEKYRSLEKLSLLASSHTDCVSGNTELDIELQVPDLFKRMGS